MIERFYENFVQGNVNNLTEVLINYKNNFCEGFFMKNKTYNKKKCACGLSRSGHSDLRIDRTAVLSDDF